MVGSALLTEGEMLSEETIRNLSLLYRESRRALETLRIDLTVDGVRLRNLFGAGRRFDGFPDYYRNFGRDSAISALLMRFVPFARDFLTLACLTQGKVRNPFTGEEPGKVIHEYPGVTLGRKNTLFNAIDSTPLTVKLFGEYASLAADWPFVEAHKDSIYRALTYIIDHIGRSMYWENPANAGAKRFALKATYWRDGGVAGRRGKNLLYPASFTLVQAQTVAALRAAASIAKRSDIGYSPETLRRLACDLLEALLSNFWDAKREAFPIAIDGRSKIFAPYSDSLHIPFYLNDGDFPPEILNAIFSGAEPFETPFGYVTYREDKTRTREFIASKIWPWEAPIIATSALRYGRVDIARNAFRVVNGMAQCERPFCEWLNYNENEERCSKGGCDVQLWSIAGVWGLMRLYRKYTHLL